MSQKTDENIASEVQKGHIHEFGVLVERYEKKLLRYAQRFLFDQEDSKDIVQEVFLKAFKNIQSFDPARSFNSWIYRVAHNEFINNIKKEAVNLYRFLTQIRYFRTLLLQNKPMTRLKILSSKQCWTNV